MTKCSQCLKPMKYSVSVGRPAASSLRLEKEPILLKSDVCVPCFKKFLQVESL